MNAVFVAIVMVSFVAAAIRQLSGIGEGAPAPMEALGRAALDAANASVTLAIGMVGAMALFLGLMKVAEKGGLLIIIARTVRPLMVRLFPDVPPAHPAMGAMVLNISANVLGLGNAATPFGIRAMQELDKLNPHKGIASDAMAMFLVINTASVTLLPTGVVVVRAAAGSQDPAGIVPTTLFATIFATSVAILAVYWLKRYWPIERAAAATPSSGPVPTGAPFAPSDDVIPESTISDHDKALAAETDRAYPAWVSWLVLAGIVALIPITVLWGREIAPWFVPGIMFGLLAFGAARRVKVYDAFVEGAKEGFNVALRIIPYLVAILVAVAMFRTSGALDALIKPLGVVTAPLGLPAEALPMAILRSFSGSGAFGVMTSILQDPDIGPDSYVGYLVSTIQGSSETTFYVLAVYFGAVGVRRIRHTLAAGLIADFAGVAGSVAICLYLFGDK